MSLQWCIAVASFQCLTNKIFYDFNNVALFSYIQDLLAFIRAQKSYLKHFVLLTRLKEHELLVSPRNDKFLKYRTEFLEFTTGKNGLEMSSRKARALKDL